MGPGPTALALAVSMATPLAATRADAAEPRLTVQIGLGAGLSVILGQRPEGRRRVGAEAHLFGEVATQHGSPEAQVEQPLNLGVSAGGTFGIRTAGPRGPRLELCGRAGPALTDNTDWGHTTLASIRAVAGAGVSLRDGEPALLLALNGRTVLANVDLVQEWPLRDGSNRWLLGLGLELGAVPAVKTTW